LKSRWSDQTSLLWLSCKWLFKKGFIWNRCVEDVTPGISSRSVLLFTIGSRLVIESEDPGTRSELVTATPASYGIVPPAACCSGRLDLQLYELFLW
jgi:hypothetical protein